MLLNGMPIETPADPSRHAMDPLGQLALLADVEALEANQETMRGDLECVVASLDDLKRLAPSLDALRSGLLRHGALLRAVEARVRAAESIRPL